MLGPDADSRYRSPDERLLDAVRTGQVCDFSDGSPFTREEMAGWGADRTVSAALLRQLLLGEHPDVTVQRVAVRGAVIAGVLAVRGASLVDLDLTGCRLGPIDFGEATFTGEAGFGGATFEGEAGFGGATFEGAAGFGGATFEGEAGFGGATFEGAAGFGGATFTGEAWFADATFEGDAWFADATFEGDAWFADATFTGKAWFADATFTGEAWFTEADFKRAAWFPKATFTEATFGKATFEGDAWFDETTFTGAAWFYKATFTGDASFAEATFTGDASFAEATFTGDASFSRALADRWDLSQARFESPDPGPWSGSAVFLTQASLQMRSRVDIVALNANCVGLQVREGAHLVIRAAALDLADSEFLGRSILTAATGVPVAARDDPGSRPAGFDDLSEKERAQWVAREAAYRLATRLNAELAKQQLPGVRVLSLARANVGNLVLAGVGLEYCSFAGTHGLDRVRIDAACTLPSTPAPQLQSPRLRLITRRRVIEDEIRWRRVHTRGWGPPSPLGPASIPALEIAGIYRDLRKGLEDTKDEPGAADFYYGEMEMRRLAVREHRERRRQAAHQPGHATPPAPPTRAERWLLWAYWAVSGYGLRASRALATLAIVLFGSAVLFTHTSFTRLPTPVDRASAVNLQTGAVTYSQPGSRPGSHAAASLSKAFEFSTRESLSLLRAAGTPTLVTTGPGTVVDFLLRLLGPVLLGFAILAVRGRTKR
jgi:uncharacterized protein YjbI with pentapeptide repeats